MEAGEEVVSPANVRERGEGTSGHYCTDSVALRNVVNESRFNFVN